MSPCHWVHHQRFLLKMKIFFWNLDWTVLCCSSCVGVYWWLCRRSRQDYWRQEAERNGDIQRGSRCDNDQAPDSQLTGIICWLLTAPEIVTVIYLTPLAVSTSDNSQSRFRVQVSGSQRWCECFVLLSDNSDIVLLNNFHYLVRCHFQCLLSRENIITIGLISNVP